MTPKDLISAGMDSKEASAYLSVLELGEATMSELVKKSKLKRNTLYEIIESLKQQGLVSIAKRKKRILYIAENPEKLIERAEEKRNHLEKILPELLSITNSISKKPKVRYFEGIEGIKEVYKDILRYPKDKVQAWAPENIIYELDKSFFDDYYTPRLLEQNMLIEIIVPDLPEFIRHKQENTVPTRKIQLVDHEAFPFEVEITLYGKSRLAIMSFQDQLGLIIESESISRTLKSIFKLQWESLEGK